MFGGDAVGERGGFVERADADDRAVRFPARARDLFARQRRELTLDREGNGAREHLVVGDQDALRGFVVFGLGEQISCDPSGIVRLVGDDQHFRGTGNGVDTDLAEDLTFRGGDIGVARADDLVDGGDRLRAVCEGRDRLRAADAIDLVHADKIGGRQHERIELAVGCRGGSDKALHARDLRRDRVHQHA